MRLVLLATLVSLQSPDLERTFLFRFQSFDAGLPRSGQWRHGFAVADMNGDGRPDLAFSSPRKQAGPPVIFLNEGNGQWRRWQEARFPALPFDYGAVAAADFDGNGTSDLAIGSHYRGVMVVLGDGRGTFAASPAGLTFPPSRQAAAAPFSSRALVAVDWNRDGRVDLAALSDGPRPLVSGVLLGVTVFENLGSAWKQTRAPGQDVLFGDSIAAGDVDGDGLPDLVTASHNTADSRILRPGSSALERREVQTLLRPDVIRAVDVHDFDADGRDEIVIAYTSPAEPRQATIELVSFPAGSGPPRRLWSGERIDVVALAAGDVNGDGAPDVVAGMQDGRLLTFRGDGRGFLTRDADLEPPQWRRGCTPYGVRLADLNGDGRDEVIAAFAGEESGCASNGGVEVWRTVPAARRRAVRQ